ncbi:DEAD/DEAH box helicase [Enterococcus sp. LJL98]
MIFSERSLRMLKYEKTKAKLEEFGVEKEKYPNFILNSSDLVFSTVYTLSKYCEDIESNEYDKLASISKDDLKVVAQYYEYTVQAKEISTVDSSLLLLGTIAYFCIENFGSAKVLLGKIEKHELNSDIEKIIYRVLFVLLFNRLNEEFDYLDDISNEFIESVEQHYFKGAPFSDIVSKFEDFRRLKLLSDDYYDVTYLDFFCPILILAKEYSAWEVLPKWSDAQSSDWKPYLLLKKSIHFLWPAQKIIVEKNVLMNGNCVIPLPTGVGKTKSFELIVYSKLFIQGKRNLVIIAPLRALCNEIVMDIKQAFNSFKEVKVTKFTDVYQEDKIFDVVSRNIIVSTPEKFAFILRHEPQFIDVIDLFIFDEAHLFDDSSRGVNYELLITDIKRMSHQESQLILFSAILSNSDDISTWLFDNDDLIVNAKEIETSEKSVGYLSETAQIHYFEPGDVYEESFFVPSVVETIDLNINNNSFLKWFFPRKRIDEDRRRDLCIYFSNRLVVNGGTAIFVGQPASIKPIIDRMIAIESRGYNLNNFLNGASIEEVRRFKNLFELHYGEDNIYTRAATLGIFPHYSNLNDGVRESIEHAMKKGDVKAVICTSTLAEGVNIPLKYLLIYSLSQGTAKMENRKITNLIGRTARSGIYTEGSILLTNENLYSNRKSDFRNRNIWKESRRAFSGSSMEECKSNILLLVESYSPNYGVNKLSYDTFHRVFTQFYLEEQDWKVRIRNMYSNGPANLTEMAKNKIQSYLDNLFLIIDSLENYLSFIYADMSDSSDFYSEVNELLKNTFAFYLSSSEQEELLESIFHSVASKVDRILNEGNKYYFAKSLYGFDVSTRIINWLDENEFELTFLSEEGIIREVFTLFYEIYGTRLDYDIETYLSIMDYWISKKSVIEIRESLGESDILKVEKLLSKTISYDLTLFIGTIVDGVTEENELLAERIKKIQKMLKYGVDSWFCISFCEKIVNDRRIAAVISNLLGNPETTDITFSTVVNAFSEDILWELEDYPMYYSKKVEQYTRN